MTPPTFADASPAEIQATAAAARAAFDATRDLPAAAWAALVRGVADQLEPLGDELLVVADKETSLGLDRLTGERARTCGQLRAFADLVEAGDHLDAFVHHADPTAQPPRPDLRRANVAIGPVAVFAASNFPLAFGVPGGDTAAALAAGCPVVAKAHPSQPATAALCADAIDAACRVAGFPAGTFTLLHGAGERVGAELVQADEIEAVAFTGSLAGGRALYDLAAARPRPIPVYAEMGSVNPVFVTGAALAARGRAIAEGLAGSVTLGTGQFCTKPGLVFVVEGGHVDGFVDHLVAAMGAHELAPMLNTRLRDAFDAGMAEVGKSAGVSTHRCGDTAVVAVTDAGTWAATPALAEEHFGPATVVVRCRDEAELLAMADRLVGNLTASVHAEPHEVPAALVDTLVKKVGRIVWNGWPTGVTVSPAMMHGGPYPASTAPAHTSVGATAIRRFLRPVAWQGVPDALLPPAVQEANPLGLRRWVDGAWT